MWLKIITSLCILLMFLTFAWMALEGYRYLELISVRLPKSKEKRKRFNLEKEKRRERMWIELILFALFTLLTIVSLFFTSLSVNAQNKELKAQLVTAEEKNKKVSQNTETTDVSSDNSDATSKVVEYTGEEWNIKNFSWKLIVKEDNQSTVNYETKLSDDMAPYVGKNIISMRRSVKSATLTVSVFSNGLSQQNYESAKKNVEKLVKDLNSVPEVTIIDFTFSYNATDGTHQKESTVYTRNEENDKLEKIDLQENE